MQYHKSLEQVFKEFNTSKQGLTSEEAKKRLGQYGFNVLKEKKGISPIEIFFNQFKSFIVYILIGAVVISVIMGEYLDSVVIGVILVLNAVFGFIQEFKAEKSIDALKKLTSLKAKVLRDGKEYEIDGKEIVPGDILLLEEGDKISADARLIEGINLETQEASLTGESTPVEKKEIILKENTPIAEQKNMVFSSTIITKGRGKAIVVKTGMKTEIGKIATMIQEAEVQLTPLQKKLAQLGTSLGMLTIGICLIVFLTGIIKGGEIGTMLMAAIALAVAAIPEGLPAVVTISLALGVQRMIKRNALIRKLPSVETLGCTTIICSDKTGTLTHNQMTVQKLYVNGEVVDVTGEGYSTEGEFSKDPSKFKLLLKIGALCNDSVLQEKEVIGDPTEAALIVSAAKAGLDKDELEKQYPRISEVPFDSKRKLMTTVHSIGGKKWGYVKGAPDVLLKKCNKIYEKGNLRALTEEDKKKIMAMNEEFATYALRVLAFGCKKITDNVDEENLTFVGLQGMIDPPREEAKVAIAKCKKAGIRVAMITGDHKTTAIAIARKLGLEGNAITGQEIDECQDLSEKVKNVSIFARVSPAHKMKIVEAFRKDGHIIAMTGDGVNDAPALKDADIGIAMGITGTDVAKEASAMILTDDNFASIVNAVEEGRSIYDNIKKFVNYLLSSNFGEVLVLFIAMLIGFEYEGSVVLPLVAVQILWMNLITDGLPALALGIDPISSNVMERTPRDPKEHIVSKNMVANIIVIGILICVATLILFDIGLSESVAKAQTIAFTTLVVLEIVRVYMIRSQYNIGVFSNKWLLGAIGTSIFLQLLVIYTPLNVAFKTTPLALSDWALIILTTVIVLVIGLIASKIIVRLTKQAD